MVLALAAVVLAKTLKFWENDSAVSAPQCPCNSALEINVNFSSELVVELRQPVLHMHCARHVQLALSSAIMIVLLSQGLFDRRKAVSAESG